MTETITPDEVTGFADITRPNFAMNQTVSATATAQSPEVANTINVTASIVAPDVEPDLVITDGVSSVSITGAIQDPFVDRFTYVDEGRSDLNQTPTTVERIVNMPDDKIFFNLDQDNQVYVSRFFLITCLLYTSPSPRDRQKSRMPSSA